MLGKMRYTKLFQCASLHNYLDKMIPDRAIIMNFRHLLKKHKLTRKLFRTVNQWLFECGVIMTLSTLVNIKPLECHFQYKRNLVI